MASQVYDRNGKLIGNLYYYNRIYVNSDRIAKDLRNAVVAIEDARFYQHNGVDVKGMARALIKDLMPGGGAMEGGSTITQQLAKISLLTSERTLSRKIQDISLALEIEQVYTKKEILEMYLNSVYLAHGNVGAEAASRYYFGKSANQLTLAEAATIAGMIQSPENYSPYKYPDKAKQRRNIVLQKMLEHKYITKAQYQTAVKQAIRLAPRSDSAQVAGYFLDYMREYLLKEGYTEEQLRFGGYKFYSTLDLNAQKNAELTMAQIPKVQAKVQPQGALISMNPTTGEILAMVGGRNYAESQYNRAIRAYRQPGSAIKPFVYATAIEHGYTAATTMEDRPLSFTLGTGTTWSPANYDRQFHGRMTLREALRQSTNTVAVQLVQNLGVKTVAAQIEEMGVTSLVKQGSTNDLNLASLALGGLTKGVTPLELATAYSPFANQGNYVKPYCVRKILDRHGNLLKQYGPAAPKQVITPQTAYIMTMLMQDVVDRGTGFRAKLPDRPVAGKTGTTSDYTNAWFVGYTPEMLTAIWIGNDRQEQPMTYKNLNLGSAVPAEMWGNYMKRLPPPKKAATQFAEPSGIVWATVDAQSGQAIPGWMGNNTYQEVFNEKNVPESTAYKVWHWFFQQPEKAAEQPKPTPTDPNAAGQPQGMF